jgi:hypothetical protein
VSAVRRETSRSHRFNHCAATVPAILSDKALLRRDVGSGAETRRHVMGTADQERRDTKTAVSE